MYINIILTIINIVYNYKFWKNNILGISGINE